MNTQTASHQTTLGLVSAYRYPEIHPSPDRAGAPISPNLQYSKAISFMERGAEFSLSRLPGGPRSVTSQIRSGALFMLCDCHDMALFPRGYRLHFLNGSAKSSIGAKKERMIFAEKAILRFDSRMKETGEQSLADIERGLYHGILPQADLAIFSTGEPLTRAWLKELGAITQQRDGAGELFMRWGDLVRICKLGKFSSSWQEVALKHPDSVPGF